MMQRKHLKMQIVLKGNAEVDKKVCSQNFQFKIKIQKLQNSCLKETKREAKKILWEAREQSHRLTKMSILLQICIGAMRELGI